MCSILSQHNSNHAICFTSFLRRWRQSTRFLSLSVYIPVHVRVQSWTKRKTFLSSNASATWINDQTESFLPFKNNQAPHLLIQPLTISHQETLSSPTIRFTTAHSPVERILRCIKAVVAVSAVVFAVLAAVWHSKVAVQAAIAAVCCARVAKIPIAVVSVTTVPKVSARSYAAFVSCVLTN